MERPYINRPIPDFKKLHQEWDEKLQKRKAFTKKPCTSVEEFNFDHRAKTPASRLPRPVSSKSATVSKRSTKRPILGEIQLGCESQSPKKKPKSLGEPTQSRLVEFKSDPQALNSILTNTGLEDPVCGTGFKFRPSRVPATDKKNPRSVDTWQCRSPHYGATTPHGTLYTPRRVPVQGFPEFKPNKAALDSILNNRGILDENERPSAIHCRSSRAQSVHVNEGRHIRATSVHRLTMASATPSVGAACSLASVCRPSMTAQRVPVQNARTETGGHVMGVKTAGCIRTLANVIVDTTSNGKDGLAKKLFDEDDDDENSPPDAKRVAGDDSARPIVERRQSLDGEQTRLQFRQRKLARSPIGVARCDQLSEAERLKELERREKAVKLKIHLKKLQREKAEAENTVPIEREPLIADEKDVHAFKKNVQSDVSALSALSGCNTATYTALSSCEIDNFIGFTTDDVISQNNDDALETDDDEVDSSDERQLSASLENLTLDQLNQSIIDCDDQLHALAETLVTDSHCDVNSMRQVLVQQAERQRAILDRQARLEGLLAKLVNAGKIETKATSAENDAMCQSGNSRSGDELGPDDVIIPTESRALGGSSTSAFSPVLSPPLTNAQLALVRSVLKPQNTKLDKRVRFAPLSVLTSLPRELNNQLDSSNSVLASVGNERKSNGFPCRFDDVEEAMTSSPVTIRSLKPLFTSYLPKAALRGLEGASIAASLLDEEVAYYTRDGPIGGLRLWSCDRPRDPLGQSLLLGDSMHFVPVL